MDGDAREGLSVLGKAAASWVRARGRGRRDERDEMA
jgi:hypothetical protein